MMGACFLTYDIISSGIKTSAFSQDGKLLAHAYRPLVQHFSGNTAQEPVESWLSGLEETTREVAGQTSLQNLGAIAFTAMSQVCLCIDRDGTPLHEAFTWSDSRSEEVGDPISQRLSQDQVYRLTGLKNTPNSSIRKLFWIKERWPEIYEKTYKMIQCKDYLAYVLTGAVYTDFTDASSTGALDITTMDWSQEILSCLGIDRDKLPAIAHSNQIIGHVTDQAASSFGLPAGVPVVMGAGDILCSAVGAGCIEHGDVYMSLGSSSWVASCMDKPDFSTGASLNPHAIPGKFLGFVNYQTAGVVFKWLKNEVFRYNPDGDRAVRPYQNIYPYQGMEEQVRLSPPGAHGLLFLPYILEADPAHPNPGQRAPTWGSPGSTRGKTCSAPPSRACALSFGASRKASPAGKSPRWSPSPASPPMKGCGSRSSRTCWACRYKILSSTTPLIPSAPPFWPGRPPASTPTLPRPTASAPLSRCLSLIPPGRRSMRRFIPSISTPLAASRQL